MDLEPGEKHFGATSSFYRNFHLLYRPKGNEQAETDAVVRGPTEGTCEIVRVAAQGIAGFRWRGDHVRMGRGEEREEGGCTEGARRIDAGGRGLGREEEAGHVGAVALMRCIDLLLAPSAYSKAFVHYTSLSNGDCSNSEPATSLPATYPVCSLIQTILTLIGITAWTTFVIAAKACGLRNGGVLDKLVCQIRSVEPMFQETTSEFFLYGIPGSDRLG